MTENNQPERTKISAKDLGYLALPEACPRCFWIKQKCKPLPFQIFPGIFNSIDAYSKKLVHAAFDHLGHAPAWLPQFKSCYRYLKVPHWSKFVRFHEPTGIVLSGVPDGLFENIDSTITIPDYKTAKFTKKQDELFPMYEVQLNGYAFIQEGQSDKKVSDLWLIYFQPMTLPNEETSKKLYPPEAFGLQGKDFVSGSSIWPIPKYQPDGFDLQFEVEARKVDIQPGLIHNFLGEAKSILDLAEPPEGRNDCQDCANLHKMTEMIGLF